MSQYIIATVTHTPILHDGKYYDVGSQIELTQTEYDGLTYYLQFLGNKSPLANDEAIKQEAAKIADELDQQDKAANTETAEDLEATESAEPEEADKPKRTRRKA